MKITNLIFSAILILVLCKIFNIASTYNFEILHATAANSGADSETKKKEQSSKSHKKAPQKETIITDKHDENKTIFDNCDKEEKKIFATLKERHQMLLNWEKELKNKEVIMTTTKTLLDNKISDLEIKTKNLGALVSEYKKEASKSIKNLVKIYENMSPKEAAQILDRMDTNNLIEIMKYMKESKSSQIIGLMRPEKARDLTGTILAKSNEIMKKDYFQ